jgi:putative glycosyltransferase (TIGR04348 family)
MASKPTLVIVSPATRTANNGNWRTAHRWSRFLGERFHVDVRPGWSPADSHPRCMIALHARRSAGALSTFAEACPNHARVLVLTGTDLYRDLAVDVWAQRSLELATHLVVLQEAAPDELAPRHRRKCRVIYQSAPTRTPGMPPRRTFDVILVGHMRPEKDPMTPMRALLRLPADSTVRLVHIGDALDPAYAEAARGLNDRSWHSMRRYRWLGARPHGETRRRIGTARAMIVSSVMEGGANVIVEAVTAGVPVLASRIPGNIGMLGADYDGYFTRGDEAELAELLDRVSRDPAFLAHLASQCAERAALFDPAREAAEVLRLADDALAWTHARSTR